MQLVEVFLNTTRNSRRSSPCVFSMLEVFGPWHYAAVAVQYWSLISSTKVSSAFWRLWSSWHGAVTIEVLLQCSWHFKRCPLLQQQFATIANWKHRQRHNGPKALSTLTHTTPLIQSRNFKKLRIFGQISACFYLTKSRKHIKQLLTNPCRNLKSMFWQIHITI